MSEYYIAGASDDSTPGEFTILSALPAPKMAYAMNVASKGERPVYEHEPLICLALVEFRPERGDKYQEVVGIWRLTFSDWPPSFVGLSELHPNDDDCEAFG